MVADFDASEFFDIFVQEATELIDTLDQALVSLEQQPDTPDTIEEIFRAVHSLKASAASQGLEQMSHLSHAMEDILDNIRNDLLAVTPELIDLLLAGVDALNTHLQSAIAGGAAPSYGDLLQSLRETAQSAGEPAAPVKEPSAPPGVPTTAVGGASLPRTPSPAPEFSDQTIHLHISFAEGCAMPAVRAMVVLRQIETYGEVLYVEPSRQQIEAATSELDYFTVSTDSSLAVQELVELLGQVSEIDQVLVISDPLGERSADVPGRRVADLSPEARGKSPTELAKAVSRQQTIRVNVETIDALMNLAGELVINRTRLSHIGEQLRKQRGDGLADTVRNFEGVTDDMGRVISELQDQVMQARLVPIEQVFMRFPRLMRDAAREEGKQVQLVVEGADTELDRSMIEDIVDPLKHLLRNAIGHGIESPQRREQLGKPAEGTVRLSARQEESYIIIQVADDGAGMDPDRLRQAAVDKGLMSAEQAQQLSDRQALQLIFASGFSTATQVSAVSGRGVGMDVVSNNLGKIGGQVEIDSEIGRGTTVSLRVPLTRAIIEGLLVHCDSIIFALPLNAVQRVLRHRQGDITWIKGSPVITVQDEVVPLVVLNSQAGVQQFATTDADIIVVVTIASDDNQVGIVVDDIMTNEELVIAPLGKILQNTRVVSGAAILGDGRLALIVDPATVTRLLCERQQVTANLAA